MEKVLVIGATSAMASATAKLFAAEGAEMFLADRDKDALERLSQDLKIRGAARVGAGLFDAFDGRSHEALLSEVFSFLPELDVVLIAHGALPDQSACAVSFDETEKAMRINCLSPMQFLTELANRMEKTGKGSIAVFSSPAGDRGRQSNYVYGAAKGALSIFLQGLRNRLAQSGVHIMTIKPGFVSTPMTAHLPQGPLYVQPDRVARDIRRGIERRTDVLYTPWFWRYIMLIIRHIPEFIFKRMKL